MGKHNPVAIVTGASSGIGAASARLLAARGYRVGITYNTNRHGADETAAAVKDCGQRAVVRQLDLCEPEAAAGVVRALATELGGVDLLVNNAAVNPRGRLLDATVEEWGTTLNANLVGPSLLAREVILLMMGQGHGGSIVNVTSVLATAPLVGAGLYCATKSALEAVTRVMALESAVHGIRVNAVMPGHTATRMTYPGDVVPGASVTQPVIPLGRAASAAEVAQVVCFVASPEAGYVTGASYVVDGGLLLLSGPQSLDAAQRSPGPQGTKERQGDEAR